MTSSDSSPPLELPETANTKSCDPSNVSSASSNTVGNSGTDSDCLPPQSYLNIDGGTTVPITPKGGLCNIVGGAPSGAPP